MTASTRTDRRDLSTELAGPRSDLSDHPTPDLRRVVVDVAELGTLALGELAELAELTGTGLDELRYQLRPPDGSEPKPENVIRFALAIAVVLERRHDQTLELADARRWDIDLVTVDQDPTRRASARAGTRRKRSSSG